MHFVQEAIGNNSPQSGKNDEAKLVSRSCRSPEPPSRAPYAVIPGPHNRHMMILGREKQAMQPSSKTGWRRRCNPANKCVGWTSGRRGGDSTPNRCPFEYEILIPTHRAWIDSGNEWGNRSGYRCSRRCRQPSSTHIKASCREPRWSCSGLFSPPAHSSLSLISYIRPLYTKLNQLFNHFFQPPPKPPK